MEKSLIERVAKCIVHLIFEFNWNWRPSASGSVWKLCQDHFVVGFINYRIGSNIKVAELKLHRRVTILKKLLTRGTQASLKRKFNCPHVSWCVQNFSNCCKTVTKIRFFFSLNSTYLFLFNVAPQSTNKFTEFKYCILKSIDVCESNWKLFGIVLRF